MEKNSWVTRVLVAGAVLVMGGGILAAHDTKKEQVRFGFAPEVSRRLVELFLASPGLVQGETKGLEAGSVSSAGCQVEYLRETNDSVKNRIVCVATTHSEETKSLEVNLSVSRISPVRQFDKPNSANLMGPLSKVLWAALTRYVKASPQDLYLRRGQMGFTTGDFFYSAAIANAPGEVQPDGSVRGGKEVFSCDAWGRGQHLEYYFCSLRDERE